MRSAITPIAPQATAVNLTVPSRHKLYILWYIYVLFECGNSYGAFSGTLFF